MQLFLLFFAIVIGHVFAYVDSRSNFDDTGVLAFAIAIASASFAFVIPRRPWLWAVAIGIWVPLHNFFHNGHFGSILAFVFALAGAYLGAGIRKCTASAE